MDSLTGGSTHGLSRIDREWEVGLKELVGDCFCGDWVGEVISRKRSRLVVVGQWRLVLETT